MTFGYSHTMKARRTALVVALTLAGCGGEGAADAAPPLPEARLPEAPGAFAPSFARVADGETIDTEAVADMGQCETCHQEIAAQWRSSPHAQASFGNPYYRASVDRFRT